MTSDCQHSASHEDLSSHPPCFILVAEPGRIERQAVQFVRTLRANGGRLKKAPIWVYYDVRPGQGPLAPQSVEELKSLEVILQRPKKINVRHAHYPYVNKIYAMADAEEHLSGVLTWVDSDILCFQEPTALLMPSHFHAAACPVRYLKKQIIGGKTSPPKLPSLENAYPGALGWYWKELYRLAELKPHQYDWPIFTLAGTTYPHINSGVMQVRSGYGVFIHARKLFDNLSSAFRLILSHEWMRAHLEQALSSACLLRAIQHPDEFHQLPLSYNMQLHTFKQKAPEDPVHLLHYHQARFEDLELGLVLRSTEESTSLK